MARLGEPADTVRTARDASWIQLVRFKCTSTYHASPVNTNIRTIPHLRELFGCEDGISAHKMGPGVAVAPWPWVPAW
ncbi:N-acetylneuraminate synthase family protein [Synechococcus sp. EJ6-Ellesmere]|nr:N-acetylneuraminate synthase family protein [Synechococcus sp. EJ6-Ellesmere]